MNKSGVSHKHSIKIIHLLLIVLPLWIQIWEWTESISGIWLRGQTMNGRLGQIMSVNCLLFTNVKQDNLVWAQKSHSTDKRINPANATILEPHVNHYCTCQMFWTAQPARGEVLMPILLIVFVDKCLQSSFNEPCSFVFKSQRECAVIQCCIC